MTNINNKRKIINISLVVLILVGVFFIVKFDVIGKIEGVMNKQVEKNNVISDDEQDHDELKYETFLDENGNEIVIEMEKVIVKDEDGNEVEMWVDTAEPEIIYDYMYKGTIVKIKDNKIYFMVDKESKNGSYFCEDVEDYEIVFDINTYNLESDPYDTSYSVYDFLSFDYERFYSAGELEFLVGRYLRVQDSVFEDSHTGEIYKGLDFYLQ